VRSKMSDREHVVIAAAQAIQKQLPGTRPAFQAALRAWCAQTKLNAIFEIDPTALLAEWTEQQDEGCEAAEPLRQAEGAKADGIKRQFLEKWLHKEAPAPRIKAVYEVRAPTQVYARFKKRQKTMQERMKDRAPKEEAGPGNTVRRFHGTKRRCALGETSLKPCTDEACNICSIIRTGFRLPSKDATELRFGRGIYCTATSSKADTYTNGTGVKATFVVSVVAGRVDKHYDSWTPQHKRMTQPRPGCDSVLGEVPPAWETSEQRAEISHSLNYDELVVYTPNSILATSLILYE